MHPGNTKEETWKLSLMLSPSYIWWITKFLNYTSSVLCKHYFILTATLFFQSPGISHLGSCDRLLPSLPGWVPPCSQFTFLFPSEGSFWKANLIISIWLKSPQKLLFHDKIQIPFPGLKGLSWLSLTHHHPLPSPGTVRTCELMPGDHRNGPCFPWLWGICFLLLLVFKHSDDLLPSVSYRVLQAWLRTEVPSGLMRLKWNYPQRRVLETRRENPFPCLFQLLFLNFQF